MTSIIWALSEKQAFHKINFYNTTFITNKLYGHLGQVGIDLGLMTGHEGLRI